MAWYKVDTILELFVVAGDYPEGIVSLGPDHRIHFHLQELVLDHDCYEQWKIYYASNASRKRTFISLFSDYKSSLLKDFDQVRYCGGCKLPLLDHATGETMSTPLLDRLAFALRAHVNANTQGRTVSEDVKRISIGALNEFEAGKFQDAQDADKVLQRLGDDHHASDT